MKKKLLSTLVLLVTLSSLSVATVSASTRLAKVKLWAGQNTEVGFVTVDFDGSNLIVTFIVTASGWTLGETHLYAGITPPTKAAPGKFPYSSPTGEYVIPLSDIGAVPGDTVYFAAHAVVWKLVSNGCSPIYEDETAWAWEGCCGCGCGCCYLGHYEFDKGWAMYFAVNIPSPCIP